MKMQNSFRMTLATALIAITAAISSTAALAQGAPRVAMNWQSLGVISGGISVSTSSSPTLLPIGGDTIWACNTGTNDAYLAFGGSSVAAVIGANGTSWLKAGTCSNYSRLNASGQITTYVAALTAAGTTTVALETGVGSGPAQSTSSGGGSGGNVNVTQWASVGLAAPTAWGTAPIGGSIVPNMNVNCLAGCASGTNTTATGAITSTQSVTVTPGAGQSTVGIQVTGTWTGTLFVEGSVDGTNYVQTTLIPILSGSVQTATITANGIFQANVAGLASFRIRGSTVASGTATVTLISSGGAGTVMADNPFPVTGYTGMTALNVIGNTAIGSATSDKPLMMGGSSTGASGGNAQVAKVSASGLVSVDGSAVTQPISAASLPLPTGAATAANQATNGATTAHTCSVAGFSELGCLGQIDDDVKGPIAAGTNSIGQVGSDPSSGKGTPTEVFLALPATTTTQIIALSGTKVTYVTLAKVFAGGTVNVTFKYGTGTNCATGTTTLEGPYPFTAQSGTVEGNGAGPVMIVPSGQALCITTDASVSGGVKLIYQQI